MTVINQNLFQDEIERRLNLGNNCYNLAQNLSFSHQLPKQFRTLIIQIYKFGCGVMWVWNLISYINGATETESVLVHSTGENIWV
jgi:hypothetical protein